LIRHRAQQRFCDKGIIDDDAQTRLLVTETLEPEGFGVEEAASGEADALAAARASRALPAAGEQGAHERI